MRRIIFRGIGVLIAFATALVVLSTFQDLRNDPGLWKSLDVNR